MKPFTSEEWHHHSVVDRTQLEAKMREAMLRRDPHWDEREHMHPKAIIQLERVARSALEHERE